MYVNRNPEYFLTIAREGNISHAAEKLFLTQSSLSQHLQRLEREVGMPLVDRSTIPLRLTPAGKIYREYLETHAYLYQKMVADMNSSSGGETVTVGIGTWRGARLMPKILPDFLKAHPDADIRLEEAPQPEDLFPAILNGNVSFGIRSMSPYGLPQGIVTETLMQEKILLVLPKDHRLADQFLKQSEDGGSPDLRLLQDERFISRGPEIILGTYIDNFLMKNRLTYSHKIVTSNNNTAVHLTAAGAGFCFMLEEGLRNESSLDVACIDLHAPELVLPLIMMYQANRYFPPLTAELMDRIREYYRNFRKESP